MVYYLDMKNYEEIISRILIENSIEPTKEIFDKLEKYYELLIEYNKNVNLTAITEKQDVFIKHFADSMLGVKNYKKDATVCDIGTGAGFPGVVLKIVRPDLKICLVDSLNKRVVFLNNIIKALELHNISALHHRAEDKEFKDNYLNSFDYVVARAVASMETLTEYCLPFVKIGGYFIAYKSNAVDEELNNAIKCIKTLAGKLETTEVYNLDDELIRKLVFIKKIANTDKKYPRDKNKARLDPIK